MSLFSDNIRYLRESRGESQFEIANSLEMKRGRYEPYESGKVEPPYDILKKISHYFGVSIDLLLSVDVRKYDIDKRPVQWNRETGKRAGWFKVWNGAAGKRPEKTDQFI